jgi:hypothetical protein
VCTYVVPGSTLSAAFLSSINLSVPIYASLSLSLRQSFRSVLI